MRAAEEGKQSKQAEQEGDHRAEIFSGSAPPDQSLGAGWSFGEGQLRPDSIRKRIAVSFALSHGRLNGVFDRDSRDVHADMNDDVAFISFEGGSGGGEARTADLKSSGR